ncbi:hypothetical protein [Mycobacterium attenuatum]|uniref:hypothetical protein n=1 Tax=Mycobacterium attenuatum TaxID=2341086 RepID=UPI001B7D60DC|nr:hypothetical protein [Mycobacterium attenuatum]
MAGLGGLALGRQRADSQYGSQIVVSHSRLRRVSNLPGTATATSAQVCDGGRFATKVIPAAAKHPNEEK